MPTMDPNEGSATGYSVSPSLPSGLVLSSITGSITGTPSVTQVAKTYTITTTNSGGSTTFTGLSIEVLAVPPYSVGTLIVCMVTVLSGLSFYGLIPELSGFIFAG
jgi:hypothetical protein